VATGAVGGVALTKALARRLDRVVPRPIRVWADKGLLWATDAGAAGIACVTVQGRDEDFDSLAHGVWGGLNHVQDAVVEYVHHGWPPVRPGTSGENDAGIDLPMPGYRVTETEVHLWYGDESSPALTFEPIPLSEVMTAIAEIPRAAAHAASSDEG
jgi:hypothetical protein